ncbi:flavin-containing monooxygenase [Aspergillus lucknowensis]|uniref:FAD/NAD(P)-binding domain-containing protein n=1 Tax=Aspergillus lucknowensis TaxID=176173 RepID=A0ABR4LFQ3_9EURO
MKTNLREFAQSGDTHSVPLELDALIVGAGFSGVYCFYEIWKLGLKAAIFEAGSGPGVDSELIEYQLSIPETWKDWNWSTNYPAYDEIRAYFDHVGDILKSGRWHVTAEDSRQATAKYLVVGSGFAAKRYVSDWPGIESYRGLMHQFSFWPEGGVDVRGKRCAIIGTGATGVQITQALGPVAGSLTVFQRMPNLAVPMVRHPLSVQEQEQIKPVYPELFRLREKCAGGFLYTFSEKSMSEDSKKEQEEFLERLWAAGGFRYWLGTYKDMLSNVDSNRIVYDFWARKIRPRIQDEKLRDLLAPLDPPHAFGIKRPSLETDYFEQFSRPTVHLVDVRDNPIARFTETGLELVDGTQHEFDVICAATGFDVSSGGLMDMGLKSIHGTPLKEKWKDSVHTYLGMTISGYPNLFFSYGPQGATALCNGPSAVEVQGWWNADAINLMERRGMKRIDLTPEAARSWKHKIDTLSNQSPFPTVKSTYMGGTFPGKPFAQLNYTGGLPSYLAEIREALPGFRGFRVEYLDFRRDELRRTDGGLLSGCYMVQI